MKTKILLSILTLGFILSVSGQKPTIELTFTTENNGQYIPMDSILIENLTQGGDTTLYAPDTILSFEYSLGQNEIDVSKNSFSISQNYPNPFKSKTTFSLYLKEKEYIIIDIRDILGRKLVEYDNILNQGNHTFSFHPGKEKYYLLTVTGKQQRQTIKMINSNGSRIYGSYGTNCKIIYKEFGGKLVGLKTHKTQNIFGFSIGDKLKFNCYSAMGDRTITDIPAGNQIYIFQYSSGVPCLNLPSIIDIDGNTYNTVKIGDQCWMKENLKTTTYRNGTQIPNVTNGGSWSNLTTGAFVWYNNDIGWKDLYGAMYNWYATVDTNGLCPTGWHVPDDYEWHELIVFIGGIEYGNELKSCRQVNSPIGGDCNTSNHPRWDEDDTYYGTDFYGYSGLPGGYRQDDGTFQSIGRSGYWWCSMETSIYAFAYGLWSFDWRLGINNGDWQDGTSVRCIKD